MSPARSARLVRLQRPAPERPPEYDHRAGHTPSPRRIELHSLLDTLFIIAGLVFSFWLAILYLVEGFSLTPVRLLYLVGFWILLTYIALPRLHQVLTRIYLPDYFFGRTQNAEGVLSDPINLALDGSEEDLHVAMRRAGWVLAEERTVGSALDMVRSTLLRRSYPEAPVSDLYLMGRRHDFCYQQEVGGTTDKRHHVRFWRMPADFVLPGGYRADWLAAGTYDRAVGFSFFTLQVTHRIDENTDVERDYIIDTLRHADPAVEVEVIREFSTAYRSRNGQGDRFSTDGDLPVIDLDGAASRSDGATAVMLPRHRPTGTSVMTARAHEATQSALTAARSRGREGVAGARAATSDLADELAAQWHGAARDFHEAVAGAADHHIPPPSVLFTAALVALQTILVIIRWIGELAGLDFSAVTPDAVLLFSESTALPITTVVVAVLIVLMVGVMRRSRWARIAMMSIFTVDAAARLVLAVTGPDDAVHPLLVAAGASVMGMLAVSSDASRLWVQTRRERHSAHAAEEHAALAPRREDG